MLTTRKYIAMSLILLSSALLIADDRQRVETDDQVLQAEMAPREKVKEGFVSPLGCGSNASIETDLLVLGGVDYSSIDVGGDVKIFGAARLLNFDVAGEFWAYGAVRLDKAFCGSGIIGKGQANLSDTVVKGLVCFEGLLEASDCEFDQLEITLNKNIFSNAQDCRPYLRLERCRVKSLVIKNKNEEQASYRSVMLLNTNVEDAIVFQGTQGIIDTARTALTCGRLVNGSILK